MIRISDATALTPSQTHSESFTPVQQTIFRQLAARPETFAYPSARDVNFELQLREQTLKAARALNNSGAAFSTFVTSMCNPEFWIREPNGAFRLRPDRSPASAIRDIFINGPLYGFECATAIVIVFYKAVLETIGEAAYNVLFGNTYLYTWVVDRDLGLLTLPAVRFLPGDALYFDNPEYNPQTTEWQGENVIYMGGDLYYGHGIGIKTAEEIIAELNEHRRPGAIRSAFLLPQATRPNYVRLSQAASMFHSQSQGGGFSGNSGSFPGGFSGGFPGLPGSVFFRASIGSTLYVFG